MKYQNSNSNADKNSTAQVFAIAFLAMIFALAMTACSKTTKPTETNQAETKSADTNKTSGNNSSPNSAATDSTTTSGDLAGTYAVNGTGADGKDYQGEMVVTKRDAVHQMSWKVGADSYDGVAVQSGTTLAAAYTTGTDGKGCGAVIYKINEDNSLEGKWGEWGVNSIGTETAAPIGDLKGSVGAFNVSGTNADGSSYKGKLTIVKGGNDVYQFAWDTGTKFVGTGVKMGDYLAAGSGAKQCGFVIYEVKGDTLEGKWGVPGSTALGTEKATKQ